MSALYEYLLQARERDIRRQVKQASSRPSVRDVLDTKSGPGIKEHR
jgi:hypothetical protein